MCGCEKHHDDTQPCTCICREHGNFDRAYALAMNRFDRIKELEMELDHARAALAAGVVTGGEEMWRVDAVIKRHNGSEVSRKFWFDGDRETAEVFLRNLRREGDQGTLVSRRVGPWLPVEGGD